MAPSRYEYSNDRDFELAMALWCAENEPKEPRYMVKYKDGFVARWQSFDTEAERCEWIAAHPEHTILRLDREAVANIRPFDTPAAPGAPDHLDGGSAADYRAAGYHRF